VELNPSMVEISVDSGVGLIVMADGDQGNRLKPSLLKAVTEAVHNHVADSEVRFILLRSRGAHFCLGMDLSAFLDNADKVVFEKEILGYANMLTALNDSPKTTVAVVEGTVKAGGVGLAAACDIVIAAENVKFELGEAYLGLFPANVMPYLLTRRISPKRAAYLVQSAAVINARDARDFGLVEEVHPPDKMESAVRKLGRRLVRISPKATERYKTFVKEILDIPFEDRGRRAVDELVKIALEPDVRNGIRAFTEGDLPEWFDRFKPGSALTGSGEKGKL